MPSHSDQSDAVEGDDEMYFHFGKTPRGLWKMNLSKYFFYIKYDVQGILK